MLQLMSQNPAQQNKMVGWVAINELTKTPSSYNLFNITYVLYGFEFSWFDFLFLGKTR